MKIIIIFIIYGHINTLKRPDNATTMNQSFETEEHKYVIIVLLQCVF